jgi:hypothetical protein
MTPRRLLKSNCDQCGPFGGRVDLRNRRLEVRALLGVLTYDDFQTSDVIQSSAETHRAKYVASGDFRRSSQLIRERWTEQRLR